MVVKTPLEGAGVDTVYTDENGNYMFDGLPGGITYRVTPSLPDSWYPINAIAGHHYIDGIGGELSTSIRIDDHTLDVYVVDGTANIDNIFVVGDQSDFSSYRTFIPDDLIAQTGGRLIKPVKRNKGVPNVVNLLQEVVTMGGFAPLESESDDAGGMRIGISFMTDVGIDKWKPAAPAKSLYAWDRLSKWNFRTDKGTAYTDIQKTLFDRTGPHTGAPRGLDSLFRKGRPYKSLLGERKLLQPKNHNNHLYAELVALKLNIASSQMGKTPPGFGELIYDERNSLQNFRVDQISLLCDSAMTFWASRAWDFVTFDSVISKINRSFRSPLTAEAIVSNDKSEGVVFNGSRPLYQIPFLRPSGVQPHRIVPRASADAIETEPASFVLYDNFPNPFNPITTIRFELADAGFVTLTVYDILGREIATLMKHEFVDEGPEEVDFETDGLPSGVYLYRISVTNPETGELLFAAAKRMLLVK